MGVSKPSDISAAFAKLFNERNARGLLELYADSAVLTVDGSAVARGKAEIEGMFAPFLASPLKIASTCGVCHEAGDTALVRSDWTLTGPDGAVASAGRSAEVLRRGGDGQWRFIIDDATYVSRAAA